MRTPKRKERKKSSGSPLFWVARESRWSGSFGVIALAGCRLRELAAATPVPDPRVAGLPIAQEVQIIADDEGQANNPTFDTTAVSGKAGEREGRPRTPADGMVLIRKQQVLGSNPSVGSSFLYPSPRSREAGGHPATAAAGGAFRSARRSRRVRWTDGGRSIRRRGT